MTEVACETLFQSYLPSSTNQFFSKGNYWFGMADDGVFKLGQHSTMLGSKVASVYGNTDTASKLQTVSNGFDAARGIVGGTRFPFAIHQLITGQSFWQTDSHGWRRVITENGRPKRIPEHELGFSWIKDKKGIWHKGSQISLDGKYIDDPSGECLTRGWMEIAMDILIVVARILSPINWLHNHGVINLGEHAKVTGGATMAIWGLVLTLGFVQSIQDLLSEVDKAKIQKKVWDVLQGFLDLAAIPFDFGIGSAHPVLCFVGLGLNIAAAASTIAKEAVYYS